MSSSRQYCTFEVGSLFLGFDVLHVQEVLRGRDLAPVPLAPGPVSGLANLRGQIVTAIDLRRRLGLPDRPAGAAAMLVVVRLDEEITAFVVDAVGEILDVASDSFELPPETLAPAVQDLVICVHKLPKKLLHILDVGRCAALAA